VAALIPAVSISLKAWSFLSRPLKSKGSSIASRVVPATSFTMRRLLFSRRFASDDFPTFGLPMKLMQMGPRSRLSSAASPPSGSAASGGRPILSRMASRSSDSPRPCSAETQMGSPRPRRATPSRSAFSSPKSALLTTRMTGLPPLRRRAAIRSSSAVTRSSPSMMKRMSAAVSMAKPTCFSDAWMIAAEEDSPSFSPSPPVSMSV